MSNVIGRLVRRHVFGRRRYQSAFRLLHRVAVAGMNYGPGELDSDGELVALRGLARTWPFRPTVLDVGANVGDYAAAVLAVCPNANLHCFEPSMAARARLTERIGNGATIHPFGLGREAEHVTLYADAPGSGLASVHQRHLAHVGIELAPLEQVELRTLEAVCSELRLSRVDLLKLDVEGNELAVLEGAGDRLTDGTIRAIQFEFGGVHVDARVHFRDFYELLAPYFRMNRILRDGLAPIEQYRELDEIFVLSNFLCLNRAG